MCGSANSHQEWRCVPMFMRSPAIQHKKKQKRKEEEGNVYTIWMAFGEADFICKGRRPPRKCMLFFWFIWGGALHRITMMYSVNERNGTPYTQHTQHTAYSTHREHMQYTIAEEVAVAAPYRVHSVPNKDEKYPLTVTVRIRYVLYCSTVSNSFKGTNTKCLDRDRGDTHRAQTETIPIPMTPLLTVLKLFQLAKIRMIFVFVLKCITVEYAIAVCTWYIFL